MRQTPLVPTLAFVVAILCLLVSPVTADVDDLSDGVYIMHCPPNLQFTNEPASEWCEIYGDNYAVDTCEEQNPQISSTEPTVWFVLSAWPEEKQWCGTQFGFADYDAGIFSFTDWGPCSMGFVLELPTGDWPGPSAGTVIAVAETGGEWVGNFVPVYCFIGYALDEGLIPMGVDPSQDYVGWFDCNIPSQGYEPTCLPSLGILADGLLCCPEEPTHSETTSWGEIKAAYR